MAGIGVKMYFLELSYEPKGIAHLCVALLVLYSQL